MKPETIIGLSGRKESGKDTVFNLLVGLQSCRFAFADALKEEVCAVLGDSVLAQNLHKNHYRKLWQAWGDFRRAVNSEYWINALAFTLLRSEEPNTTIAVITDVRYPNEFEWIKSRGGFMVRVERHPPHSWWQRWTRPREHSGETALDHHKFDFIVRNHGDLDHLAREVSRLVEFIASNSNHRGKSRAALAHH